MNKLKDFPITVRFRGQGETEKEAENRIKRIKKAADKVGLSFANIVRQAVDYYWEENHQ